MNALCLLPLGAIDPAVVGMLDRRLSHRFGIPVRRLDGVVVPGDAYDPVRRQFEATHILRAVRAAAPDDRTTVLAVTSEDLFIPMLTFVFGQAQLRGIAAVMSTARLDQRFHGLPANPDLLGERALKEAFHELGHTIGLTHCPDRQCVMTLSNTVQQIDQKGEDYCGSCRVFLSDTQRVPA